MPTQTIDECIHCGEELDGESPYVKTKEHAICWMCYFGSDEDAFDF